MAGAIVVGTGTIVVVAGAIIATVTAATTPVATSIAAAIAVIAVAVSNILYSHALLGRGLIAWPGGALFRRSTGLPLVCLNNFLIRADDIVKLADRGLWSEHQIR